VPRNQATDHRGTSFKRPRPVRERRWLALRPARRRRREDERDIAAGRAGKKRAHAVSGSPGAISIVPTTTETRTEASRVLGDTKRRDAAALTSLQIIPLSRPQGILRSPKCPVKSDLRRADLPVRACPSPDRVSMPSCNHRKRHCRPPRQLRFRLGPRRHQSVPGRPRELGLGCRDSCRTHPGCTPGCFLVGGHGPIAIGGGALAGGGRPSLRWFWASRGEFAPAQGPRRPGWPLRRFRSAWWRLIELLGLAAFKSCDHDQCPVQ